MKQSDVFSIIIIATVGTLAAYFAVNSFLGDPNLRSVQIKTLEDTTPVLAAPDPELFNANAINPTVEVYVGDCEDIDQNGIISQEELIACGKEEDEENNESEEPIYYCRDGSSTTDTALCPENNNNGGSSSGDE